MSTEVWDESCHRLQEDSSSLGVSCPTTGTIRKDILHLLQVHSCAILRLHLFSLCIYDSGLFLYLGEDEAMALTGILAQGKTLQRFPEIFHLKLDFLMILDDRERKLISDWFKVLGDVSHFLERGAEMRVFLWTLKYRVWYKQESIRLAFSKKANIHKHEQNSFLCKLYIQQFAHNCPIKLWVWKVLYEWIYVFEIHSACVS